jgi:hypothetical protein
LSLLKDKFEVKIVGNLVADPKIAQDEEGDKVCYCKIATNPRAKKIDKRTKKVLTDKERKRLRTVAELKIANSNMAEKFFAGLQDGDRIWLEGEGGTKRVNQKFKSKKDGSWGEYEVDIDGETQVIKENVLVVRVYDFGKVNVDRDTGVSTISYVAHHQ